VIACRAMLDVPRELIERVSRLLAAERRRLGARRDTWAPTCCEPVGAHDRLNIPPNAWCFPEYQESISTPFALVVVCAQRSLRNTFPSRTTCDQPCAATD
jgi:hypothetical protein